MNAYRHHVMHFAKPYPLFVQTAGRKGRTRAEVDQVIRWLTGYSQSALEQQLARGTDLATFFAEAPALDPHARSITGVVRDVHVQTIEDPLLQKMRWLDKLIGELAKGKAGESVLRGSRADACESA